MNEGEKRHRANLAKRRKRAELRRRKVMRQRIILGGIIFLMIVTALIVSAVREKRRQAEETAARIEAEKEEEKKAAEEENNTLHFLAVGDNFYHDAILEAGKDDSGSWNFDFIYQNIKSTVEDADIAAVNQEVPLISDGDQASGYPKFGTPLAGGDALADTGFDVVTMATNHSFDKGETGITDALSFWRENHPEIAVLGIHDSEEDRNRNRVKFIQKKNFNIAMMNYTCLINEDAQVPEEYSYSVDVYDEEKAESDIAEAKEKADFLVVFLHTGTENETETDSRTIERVRFLSEQGADLVICTHPHVLRKTEMLDRADGGKTLVYYSLGNFVSAQKEIPQLLEGMADITLKKDARSGRVSIADYSLIPLVMHYEEGQTGFSVYLFKDYTEELASRHGVHGYSEEEFTMESMAEYFESFGAGSGK